MGPGYCRWWLMMSAVVSVKALKNGGLWHDNAQWWYGRGCEWDAVEPIGQIAFKGQDWAKGWVGISDVLEYPLEGVSKLHGSEGGHWDGVLVDATPGVVDDGPGAAITLGDYAHR